MLGGAIGVFGGRRYEGDESVRAVLVNGIVAMADGAPTGTRTGRFVRPER